MTKIEEQKIIAETNKLLAENRKMMSEAYLNEKKLKWYEITLLIGAGIAIGAILVKLYQ